MKDKKVEVTTSQMITRLMELGEDMHNVTPDDKREFTKWLESIGANEGDIPYLLDIIFEASSNGQETSE